MPIVIVFHAFLSKFSTTLFFSSLWTTFSLTKVGPPIFEVAVPRPFVHLRVEIMVLLSMSSDWIFVRINLNAYSNSLSHFFFKVQHYIIFSSLWTTFSLTKVGLPIFEWAVPRRFVHYRVEIMVLLSMSSDWIFVRINLNAYRNSLRYSFFSKFRTTLFFFRVCEQIFHWQKWGRPSLSGLCQDRLSIFEWK